jgi:hypothetical protein
VQDSFVANGCGASPTPSRRPPGRACPWPSRTPSCSAQCLRDHDSTTAALAAYERLRCGRAERAAAWGASPEAMDKQAWMFRHHIEWNQTGHPATLTG